MPTISLSRLLPLIGSLILSFSPAVMLADGGGQDVNMEELKQSILSKVRTLTTYISLIADKDQDNDLRLDAKELAVGLFESPDKIVEVSSLTRSAPFEVPVSNYFHRLYTYNYHQVRITYFEVSHVSQLEPGVDGSLYGTATIYQLFEAFDREGNRVYADKTTKLISIRVDEIERITETGNETYLDIKLGNIKVYETRQG